MVHFKGMIFCGFCRALMHESGIFDENVSMFALKKDMYSVWNHLSSSIRFVCFFIGLSFYLLAAGVHAATISQVSPNTGSTEGGTFVLITGTDFTGATAVRFDGVPVAALNIHDATSMTVVTTAHAAGTVTVNAYRLTYHSSAQAAGTVMVKYTLSNKAGASPPATITFTVVPRLDPTEDPDVVGLVNAQVQSSERFAINQIRNFNDRLERLHDEKSRHSTSLRLRMTLVQKTAKGNRLAGGETSDPDGAISRELAYSDARVASAHETEDGASNPVAVWTGGFVNFGTSESGALDLRQTLVGFSGGIDYRMSPNFLAGVGFGYGRDRTEIGESRSETTGQALSGAIYGSYHPDWFFIDGLAGFSVLDFESKRQVSASDATAIGQRNGTQLFGSLSIGHELRKGRVLISHMRGWRQRQSVCVRSVSPTGCGSFRCWDFDGDPLDCESAGGRVNTSATRLATTIGRGCPRGIRCRVDR